MSLKETPIDMIERLESELYQARQTIISLMPENIQTLFDGYYQCNSMKDAFAWEHKVVEQIIQEAIVVEPASYFNSSARAVCPLCGEESSDPYQRGFTLPEGLSRHLQGWGNVRQCRVTKAAFALAQDYWNTQSSKWTKTEEIQINERRNSETLFIIRYGGNPQLIDEGIYLSSVRTLESLASAEKRLAELGFLMNSDGQVKSYTLEEDRFLIFADPRAMGHIEFTIYSKPLTKDSLRHINGNFEQFRIYDNWKYNIQEKFKRRFEEKIRQHLT